ncbi:MAG: restriction endonuclease subunit S [Balneolaceae bacterium]
MREVELKDVAEVIAGQSPKSEFYNEKGEGVPFFQGKTDFGDDYPTVTTWCTQPKKMAKKGDILFSVRAPVGPTNIAKVDCCIGRGLSAIRPGDEVNRSYLRYFFKKIEEKISDQGRGSTFKAITQKDLKALKIPLPTLNEQKAIVAKLDRAQRLIDIDRQMLAKYDELIQSVFLEMFGDPVTNPKGWEKTRMDKVSNILRGGSPRPIKDYLGGNIPWIKISDGTSGDDLYIDQTKEKIIEEGVKKSRLLEPGSLILANCGVSLGFARIIKIKGCIHDGWLSIADIKENIIDPIFLLKQLNHFTDYFRRTAPDGTQPNLNTSIVKKFEIVIPSIDLQKQFVSIVLKVREETDKLLVTVKKSEELYSSLVQGVFGG